MSVDVDACSFLAVLLYEVELGKGAEVHFIVLVDLLGASVFTALCGLSVLGNVSIVAGMNVALALAALTERDETEEALARWGREGVKGCRETLLHESDDRDEF